MGNRGGDEPFEQGMRPIGPALELGVRLRANKEWVVGNLDHFHQTIIWRHAADRHSMLNQLLSKIVVDFKSVPVPLGDASFAIELVRKRASGQVARIRT